MRAGLVIAALAAFAVAGCETIDMTPLNAQAQAAGSPKLSFPRGVPLGRINVTMPDGERLNGTFTIAEQLTPNSDGNFHLTARGPRTGLVCAGTIIAGHGPIDCAATNGARYQIPL